ncbi:MAG TPA: TonB-dependent receptor, partial [Polyangiaceae bacterium]|nr:TonB-dependent receptor [Polyangiaceae bacterium]
RDMATHVYRWTGERGRPVGREGARGELRGEAIDQSVYENSFYARAGASYDISEAHVLRASITPQFIARTGDDHVPERVDLLGLDDGVLQLVGGAEYQAGSDDDALSNIAFAKGYYLHATHEERPQGVANPVVLDITRDMSNWGIGDGLRYRLSDWLLAKASYEYATRLPRPDELFGDGALVESNTGLKPEQSHNVNLGPRFDLRRTGYGDVLVDINGFLRESKDQIILLAGSNFIPYANIADMRVLGIEGALAWTAPGRWLTLDGSFTWQDVRNTSDSGPFAQMNGMRIPSRPWLFASWSARFRIERSRYAFEPFYQGRYTHGFDRGWAIGDPEFKISLPAQVNHDAGISYSLTPAYGRLGASFQVDNFTNASLFDTFGVQRPGRSLNLKVTAEL